MACHFARGVEVAHVLQNYLGRATGPTLGRDGNMHFGVRERNIFPLVSMLGALVPVTVGAALAFKRRGEPRVALTFFGDGTMSTGDVHEGLNLAAVLQVPAVFVLQNNGYAYSTPIARQMANTNMAERVRGGWGIPAERVDGTDALAVYTSVLAAIERARAGEGPQAVETAHAADARPCGPRRRPLHGPGAAAHVRRALRSRRAARGAPAARRALDRRDRRAAAGRRRRGSRRPRRRPRQLPAPDPATLADGVYATPLEGTDA